MKVLGIELLEWEEHTDFITRDNSISSMTFVDIWKEDKSVFFAGKFRPLYPVFDQLYQQNYLSSLPIEQVKELVDQFLKTMNKMELFL